MKICFLSQEFPIETKGGGIGTYTYLVSKELAKKHDVYVITETLDKNKCYIKEGVKIYGIKSRVLWLPGINIFFGNIIHRICYNLQVYKKLRSLNIELDIIQAPELGFEALFPSFNKGYKIVTRISTPTFINEFYNKGRVSLQTKVISFLEKLQVKNSKVIVSQTKFLAKLLSKEWAIPLKRIRILSNPIGYISTATVKNQIGEYILYFGRIDKRKGIDILLKALPKIFEKHPNLKMVFIGEDQMNFTSKFKRNEFKNKIIYLGYIERHDIFSFITNAKLIVMPSLFENCSNSCLEAMALGKVVIATKNTGFEELIEDDKSGFLVEPCNVTALQNKILECLERKDLRKIGMNAKKRIKSFNMKDYLKNLLILYREIL